MLSGEFRKEGILALIILFKAIEALSFESIDRGFRPSIERTPVRRVSLSFLVNSI